METGRMVKGPVGRRTSRCGPLLLALGLGLTPGVGWTQAEFDEATPNQMAACPPAVKNRFPTCSMAMVVTTDEKWVACYCDGNVKQVDSVPFPGPMTKRRSTVTIEKLVPPGPSSDPCQILVIGGKKKTVCW
jgi:hypothetical protein